MFLVGISARTQDILTDDFRGLRQFLQEIVDMGPRVWRIRQQYRKNGSWFLLRDNARAYFAVTLKHFLANRGVVIRYLLTHVISKQFDFSVSYKENHPQRKILGRRGYQDEHSEIIPTRCNNCVYSSQWLYSTCFGWQFHPSSGVQCCIWPFR